MNEIIMSHADDGHFQRLRTYCGEWATKNQWAVGAAEMALGASVIVWGIQSGNLQIGKDVQGTDIGAIGATIGGGLGALATSVIGGVGVVAMGSGIGIPAAALIAGGAAIFGAMGYTMGDSYQRFMSPPGGFGFADAAILTIGIALIVDGARRAIKDERILKIASNIKNGVIYLAKITAKVVARSVAELTKWSENPEIKGAFMGIGSTMSALGGAAIGGHLAAGSVTVLGSHALGGAALSLGLVSAPLWPVLAGGAAGLAIGVAGWKAVKKFRNKQNT